MIKITNLLQRYPFLTTILHAKNYFFSTMFIYGLGLISMPIYTRILTPSDYGIVNIWQGFTTIFFVIITLNTYTALGRYYYEDKDNFKSFCGTSLILIIVLLACSGVLLFIFQDFISGISGIPLILIPFVIPVVIFKIATSWFEQIYIPQKASSKIATRTAIKALLTLIFTIIFITQLKENKFMGSVYSNVLIGSIFLIYFYFQLRAYFNFKFSTSHLKYILSYSLPLLPYSLGGIVLAYFDRIMINKYIGSSEAGLYSFAYNIGMLLSVTTGALHRAWMPDYYKYMNNKSYKLIEQDINKIFVVITLATLFLILFGKEIGQILAPSRYHSALSLIPIVVLGYFFHSIHAFFSWTFSFAKKNIYLSIVVISGGGINILLNYIFIPRYGYIAAAYTTLGSFIVMSLTSWSFGKIFLKTYTVPILIIAKYLFILIPFLILYYLLTGFHLSTTIEFILKTLILVVFYSSIHFTIRPFHRSQQ